MGFQIWWIFLVYIVGRSAVNYELGWSAWSNCSVSCGAGFQTRSRTCVVPTCEENVLKQTQVNRCIMESCEGQPRSRRSAMINVSHEHPTIMEEELQEKPTSAQPTTRNTCSDINPVANDEEDQEDESDSPKRHRRPKRSKKRRKRKKRKKVKPIKATKIGTIKPTRLKTTRLSTKMSTTSPAMTEPLTSSEPTIRPVVKTTLPEVAITTITFTTTTINTTTTTTTKVINPTSLQTASTNKPKTRSTELVKPTKKTTRETSPTGLHKKMCLSEEYDGIFWPQTLVQRVAVQPCPQNSTGKAYRACLKKERRGIWDEVDFSDCISTGFQKLKSQLKSLERCPAKGEDCLTSGYDEILQDLVSITAEHSVIYGGDLLIAMEILKKIHNHSRPADVKVSRQYVDTASNLMAVSNLRAWRQVQQEGNENLTNIALEIVNLLEDVGFRLADAMEKNETSKTVIILSVNIAMRIDVLNTSSKVRTKGIHFLFRNTSIYLPADLFMDDVTTKAVTVIYPTLSHLLALQRSPQEKPLTTMTVDEESKRTGTTVVSSTVRPRRTNLKTPIKIELENIKFPNSSKVICVSWSLGSYRRAWSSDGCQLIQNQSNMDKTTCYCNHMTLFAALMDPYGKDIPEYHSLGLEIISLVGCSISLVAIVATFAITLFHWRKLKSPKSEILLNICFAIAVVCTLVLVERPARNHKTSCTCVAILLHYFLLSIFTWMLCEGILLRIVFFSDITGSGRSKMRHFYCFGWGFPVIIVGISAGATRLKGYGEVHHLCWLSTYHGLSWAFVAPVLVVVLVNSVILVSIMKRMFGIRPIKSKPRRERIVLGVRAMVVILPLLGITWVFGLLAFSSDTIAFKYLFAIFNSLQGVMIFIFHCILDNKVREALNSSHRRRQSIPMSITRVRPVGKENDEKHHSPPPAARMFSLRRNQEDFTAKWDDIWTRQNPNQPGELTSSRDDKDNKIVNDQPRLKRSSSLTFEMTPKDLQEKVVTKHEEIT